VRFKDNSGRGIESKVIVGDMPATFPDRPGLTTTGSIGFGNDGRLYFTVGDYDRGKAMGPNGKPYAQDLTTPLGKILRVNREDGSPADGNPFVNIPGADPRIFAYGFYKPFPFAVHPSTGKIYGTDNTAVTCEELNIVEGGANYGWPDVGDFPYSDCKTGSQKQAIHFFTKKGVNPGDFLSFVTVSGLEFLSGGKYPLIGDSLLVCQREEKLLRRVVLAGPNFDQVSSDDVLIEGCQMDVAVSPEGIVYYSNDQEIRRLVPVATGK